MADDVTKVTALKAIKRPDITPFAIAGDQLQVFVAGAEVVRFSVTEAFYAPQAALFTAVSPSGAPMLCVGLFIERPQ